MIGHHNNGQMRLFTASSLEDMVPANHILRKCHAVLDFSSFIHDVEGLYSKDQGRPSIDPEVMMRLILSGFLLGIRHDRRLVAEAQVNLGIRWFIGLGFEDPIPNHSTISRTRDRWGKRIFYKFFLDIVKQCLDAGLINANTVHIDSTLIRASVSWNRVKSVTVKHVKNLLREDELNLKADRKKKTEYICESDPDATLATSSAVKIPEPSYKQHNVVCDNGIIVKTEMTTGCVHEGHKLMEHIDDVEEITGQTVCEVTADKGYSSAANYASCEEMNICALIPTKDIKKKTEFQFDSWHEHVICPKGKVFSKFSEKRGARIYAIDPKICGNCDLKEKCFGKNKTKSITILDGHEALARARRKKATGWTKEEKKMYKRHWTYVEGVHGEMKEQHCMRRANLRGLEKVSIQGYLAACAVNIKRLIKGIIGNGRISLSIPAIFLLTKLFNPPIMKLRRIAG